MKINDIDLAVSILKTNLYAILATADIKAEPWNSPVHICNDGQLNFYWASYSEAVHSINIQNNPRVFMVMFDSRQEWGKGQGLYIRGRAAQIESEAEIAKACELRASKVKRNVQNASDFMGQSPRRMYRFTPEKIWVNNVEVVDGKIVDEKSDMAIDDLTNAILASMPDNSQSKKFSWEDIERLVDEVSDQIVKSGWRPDTIIALSRGGFVPATMVAYRLKVKNLAGLDARMDNNGKRSTGHLVSLKDLSNKKVLVIDDTINTGHLLKIVPDEVRSKGGEAKTCALISQAKCPDPDYVAETYSTLPGFPWEYI